MYRGYKYPHGEYREKFLDLVDFQKFSGYTDSFFF